MIYFGRVEPLKLDGLNRAHQMIINDVTLATLCAYIVTKSFELYHRMADFDDGNGNSGRRGDLRAWGAGLSVPSDLLIGMEYLTQIRYDTHLGGEPY